MRPPARAVGALLVLWASGACQSELSSSGVVDGATELADAAATDAGNVTLDAAVPAPLFDAGGVDAYTGPTTVRSTVADNALPQDLGELGSHKWNFGPGSLWTHRGWQYAAYWNDDRQVSVARRALPDGDWESFALTDYVRDPNGNRGFGDGHEKVSLGISSDGVIHLAFDHHVDLLHYRHTQAGVANNPDEVTWSAALFSAVDDDLGGARIDTVTYPRFISDGGDRFSLYFRTGGSGSGDSHLVDYIAGEWYRASSAASKFIDRNWSGGDGKLNAYPQGVVYHAGRLHVTWVWRDTPDSSTCHDLCYAYSDDRGLTWHNNAGDQVAVAGESYITGDTSGIVVWPIPTGTSYINGGSMVVDANGNVHVLVRGETGKLAYFTRDATTGEWDRRDPELDLNGSGNLIVGADNDLYAVVNDIWFLHASRASGWSDWSVIEQAHDNQTPNGTAAVDGRRFAADSWFSVIGQKGRDVVVMDYRP